MHVTRCSLKYLEEEVQEPGQEGPREEGLGERQRTAGGAGQPGGGRVSRSVTVTVLTTIQTCESGFCAARSLSAADPWRSPLLSFLKA